MNKIVVYPGTFDPITYGHIDIIKRANYLFGKVIVAVVKKPNKETIFSWRERVELVKKAIKDIKGTEVDTFDGLMVDYVKKKKAKIIIRGLRMISDFEYEFQMALTNRKISSEVETIFMMPNENYAYLSSKLIKEAGALGADLSPFVPDFVEEALRKKLSK